MSGSNVQYQGNHPLKTKKVYYNGSTPLTKNQMLTYVEDASLLATLQAAETAAPGSQNFGLARGTLVETPVTASLALFAGVLQDGDEGRRTVRGSRSSSRCRVTCSRFAPLARPISRSATTWNW